jgi:hypothetical protein
MFKGDGPFPANLPERETGDARDQVSKDFGVSGRMVDYAKKVIENRVPELVDAVDQLAVAGLSGRENAIKGMSDPPQAQANGSASRLAR